MLKSLEFGINKKSLKSFYGLVGLFFIIAAVALVQEQFYLLLAPIVIYFVVLAIFRMDLLALFIAFITPLSINLNKTSLGIGISLPSDPLMFGLFILFWFKIFTEGGLDKRIFKHPVTILILLHLGWMVITSLTSTMPVVSIKSTLARFCYVSVNYFLLLYIFQKYNKIENFIWLYLSTLCFVICFTIYNHWQFDWSEPGAHISMVPFYNDHTSYAAAIAFFIPVMLAMVFNHEKTFQVKLVSFIALMLLSVGIILSYTRASWVGLLAAFGCYLALAVRVKTALVYSAIAGFVLFFFLFRTQIFMELEKNDKTSSNNIQEHVESIGNVSNDASNIERLNRWSSALRMYADRPIFGFGPGTFMFQYAPYQKHSELSAISTNFGEVGGSHSEYLGPLAEEGLPGSLFMILIIAFTIITASGLFKRLPHGPTRGLAKALLLGLITYYVHGVLNYFLDTDKASVLFWGFTAAIVAIDIFHSNTEQEKALEDSRSEIK